MENKDIRISYRTNTSKLGLELSGMLFGASEDLHRAASVLDKVFQERCTKADACNLAEHLEYIGSQVGGELSKVEGALLRMQDVLSLVRSFQNLNESENDEEDISSNI